MGVGAIDGNPGVIGLEARLSILVFEVAEVRYPKLVPLFKLC
jgi:hypothetical protein